MPTLGEQLKSLRVKKGMTQEQLAREMSTTKAAISRYEKDQRQPKLEILTEIAMILDASPTDLYNLFLGSTEFEDEQGVYPAKMNAMAKWVETICGANNMIEAAAKKHGIEYVEGESPVICNSGDAFADGSFSVQKEASSDNGTMKLIISVEPEGMQLKDLISLLDYLKSNDLAGEGILELIDFVKAIYKSEKIDKK